MIKLILQKNELRKIWWAGRMGHANYLMFSLAILNFILIAYSFLIEGNTTFEKIIPNLGLFIIIFLAFYFPVSIWIGRWHTNTQISIEQVIRNTEDPILATMMKMLLDVQTGVASEEEIAKFRKFILKIENQGIA